MAVLMKETSPLGVVTSEYLIVQSYASLPTGFTTLDRKLCYVINDECFYLWNGTEWVLAIEEIGGGHTIENPSGTDMTQRANLQFTGDVTVTDDSINDRTVIEISGGGHTIEDTSGASMTQREGLQFVGVFTADDSIADRTKVNIARSMTKAQMDALTSAQKKGFIRTTDEPDNPIVDSKVTFDLTATSGNTYVPLYSNCYKVGNHVYIRAYVTGSITNTVTFATIPSQFMPQANEVCGTATVISSTAQTHGIAIINKSDNGLKVAETIPITGTAVFVMADYEL